MEEKMMKTNYIIIPALEPDASFYDYTKLLSQTTNARILIIDDGSGPDYRKIFHRCAGLPGCTVLSHTENLGKGAALKTGYAHVGSQPAAPGIVLCADCDGQHHPEDIRKILSVCERHPSALILGTRNFSGSGIPFRSVLGNRFSSFIFWLGCGRWIPDTQTGLRAFDGHLLDFMLSVPGERFEYEMQVLIRCTGADIPIRQEPIRTIYIEGNEGSHFRPVRDSIRILKTLCSELGRFSLSSLFCAVLDLTLFQTAVSVLPLSAAFGVSQRITAATLFARLFSSLVNYAVNRSCVFSSTENRTTGTRISLPRYFLVCVGIAASSAISVSLFTAVTGWTELAVKIICDALLFVVSYRIQKQWVFAPLPKEDCPK